MRQVWKFWYARLYLGHFNIEMPYLQYKKSHFLTTSHLYDGHPCSWKYSLYAIDIHLRSVCVSFDGVGNAVNGKYRADSRLAPSQWETALQSNAISHWLAANLESALKYFLTHCRPKKLLHAQKDDLYQQGLHELHETHKLAEQVCRYDLDDLDVTWLSSLNEEREAMGKNSWDWMWWS